MMLSILGSSRKPIAVEDHKEAKQEDAGQFDDGAPGHPVIEIIEKIEAIAADGQNDKGIQLPEFVPWGTGMGGMVDIGINRLNIN